jgi:hypothetical protein
MRLLRLELLAVLVQRQDLRKVVRLYLCEHPCAARTMRSNRASCSFGLTEVWRRRRRPAMKK